MTDRPAPPVLPTTSVFGWMRADSDSRNYWKTMAKAAVAYAEAAPSEEDYDGEVGLSGKDLARFALGMKVSEILDTVIPKGLESPENPLEELVHELAEWALKQVDCWEVAGALIDDLEVYPEQDPPDPA